MRVSCLPPVIDRSSRVLILGTMPGIRSLQQKQYYANPANHFWQLIYHLFDLTLEAEYNDRIKLIKARGIGLWDVLSRCQREGSSDTAIRDFEINDFSSLLSKYRGIRCLAFSSRRALDIFKAKVLPWCPEIHARGITLLTLPSPSGQNARMNFAAKLKMWQTLNDFLEKMNQDPSTSPIFEDR